MVTCPVVADAFVVVVKLDTVVTVSKAMLPLVNVEAAMIVVTESTQPTLLV